MVFDLSIIEPHPSVPQTGLIYGGRGGAGNYKRYKTTELTPGTTATGPPSRGNLSAATTAAAMSANKRGSFGRGGAGNMFARHDTEERVFQFDEEMMWRREDRATPVYHIGRGGAANWASSSSSSSSSAAVVSAADDRSAKLERSDSASSDRSVASDASREGQVRRGVESALGRLAKTFS